MLRIACTTALSVVVAASVAHGASTGACDPAWSDDFRAPAFVNDIWCFAMHDDAVHTGGAMQVAGGTPVLGLARRDGDGWSRVDMGQGLGVMALASIVDGDGPALFAAGYRAGSGSIKSIWRMDASGARPIAVFDGWVRVLTWFDGKLYAGGDFDLDGLGGHAERETVACWDGEAWTRPGGEYGALRGKVDDLAVYDDGSGPALYAVGDIIGRIARWDGVEWRTHIGGGLNSRAGCLEVYDDGTGERLYTSGYFTMAGDVAARGVAAWDGVEWSALGDGLPMEDFGLHRLAWLEEGAGPVLYASQRGDLHRWDGATWTTIAETDEYILDLLAVGAGTNAKLYIGGSFDEIGGVTALKIATWDGTTFADAGSDDVGNAPDYQVEAFAIYRPADAPRADVYAGGAFATVGGAQTCNVARFDGRRWLPVGDVEAGCSSGYGQTNALAVFDDGAGADLYAGGSFDQIAGVPARGIARWDGTTWSDVGGGVAGDGEPFVNAIVLYDDGTGPSLVAAGLFETAGGVRVSNVARWDGERWASFGEGLTAFYPGVTALAVFDDGTGPTLYAAGRLNGSQDDFANVRRWTGATWEDVSPAQSGAQLEALAAFDDGTGPALYAGGRQFLMRYDGVSWANVVSETPTVNAFAPVEIDGVLRLALGGYFDSVEGVPINGGVALWDGHSMSPLDGSTAGIATSLLADPVRGALWVGGSFVDVGNDDVVSFNVARWGCPICLPDLSDDQSVGWADLLSLLESWGASDGAREDLDDDGVVGFGDLMQLLAAWGPC